MGTPKELAVGAENRNRKGQWGKHKGQSCKADGCDKPAKCRGFCDSHYGKWKWATGHRPPSAEAGSESRISAKLKHHYGIDLAEYNRLLAAQDGKCAICKIPSEAAERPKHWKQTLCVDHDHDTGFIRGLLCNACNLTVKRRNTIEVLQAAIRYLRLHE